jgi:hypothetical protein
MSHPFDRRLADDPPVQPERVMPVVATLLTGIALALVAVGLATLWPVLASVVPATPPRWPPVPHSSAGCSSSSPSLPGVPPREMPGRH